MIAFLDVAAGAAEAVDIRPGLGLTDVGERVRVWTPHASTCERAPRSRRPTCALCLQRPSGPGLHACVPCWNALPADEQREFVRRPVPTVIVCGRR